MTRWPLLLALLLPAGAAWAQVSPNPQSGVPTATGTLQGVADFVWNGTAWVAAATAGSTPGTSSFTKPGTFTPLGCPAWQTVTTGSAVLLSAVSGGIPAGATLVDIVPSVAVVMRDDGSAPTTAGPGIPIQASTIYPYSGTLSAVRFISQSASGTVAVCFYQ